MLNREGRALLWLRTRSRHRKAGVLRRLARGQQAARVLLIGCGQGWSDLDLIVERSVADGASTVVATDLHRGRGRLPWPYVCSDGLALPFATGSFDLGLSNAVIEHVGGAPEQRRFVAEHVRVAERWIITTPNRWFPIEPHTGTLFRHWTWSWRSTHTEVVTRPLSRREFAALLPSGTRVVGRWWSPTLLAVGRGGSVSR